MTDLDCGETDVEWGGQSPLDLYRGIWLAFTLALALLAIACWSQWPTIQAGRVEGMNRIHEAHATATALWRE